jgi:iron complex transport system substrate-binding protein
VNKACASTWSTRRLAAGVACISLLACGRAERSDTRPASEHPPAAQAAFPTTVVDALGRSVTVSAAPKRIVSLLPSHTEVLFALGVGDRVVGVDEFSDYPPEAARLPKLGNLYESHLEALLAAKPDLVVTSDLAPAVPAMAGAGLVVWAQSPTTIASVCSVALTLGTLVGRTGVAHELCERITREVDAAAAAVHSVPRRRVYYELDATPYAVGPRSFVGELLAKAGGDNVIPAGLGEFPKVSPELVTAADPEVILGATLEDVTRRPGWERITAVRNKCVFTFTPEERAVIVRPGPRLAAGLTALASRLRPETAP